MVGGLAITILCCVSAAAHCMLFRTLYRNGKWAPSAKPPKVLPAPGTLKSFADVAAVTGKGKRLKGQADGLACAPSGDSPSTAALASDGFAPIQPRRRLLRRLGIGNRLKQALG